MHVQLPRTAVGADTSPVMNPERGVGHLLDLGEQHPAPIAWTVPGLDHDAIAGPGGKAMEQRLDLPLLDRRANWSRVTPAFSPA